MKNYINVHMHGIKFKIPNAFGYEEKLNYPTKLMRSNSEEYLIPLEDKPKVLKKLYCFRDVPQLEDKKFDIHEGKWFEVKDFKVVRENDVNYLVSPYYYKSGGTVIDWAEEGY